MATMGARFGSRVFQAASRTNMSKRLGEEIGEWAVGQAVGSVLDPQGSTSKAGYLQSAGNRKIGSAVFNFAADMAADHLKKLGPQNETPANFTPPLAHPISKTPEAVSFLNQNLHGQLRSATPAEPFKQPMASFRDSSFGLSKATLGMLQSQLEQPSKKFDSSSLSSHSSSLDDSLLFNSASFGKSTLLQMYSQRTQESTFRHKASDAANAPPAPENADQHKTKLR